MNKKNYAQERAIIAECKKDIKAFSKLYKKYTDDVYRYVYVIVKNREKAEDITSQTFLAALEKIREFEWREISVKYWFLKIAKNLIFKSRKKVDVISLDEKIQIKNLDEMLVEDIVVQEDLKNRLKELILKLDETTREIITLRIWQGMKFRQISKFLDMNESTVKNRFSRGVKKLKRILEKEEKKRKKMLGISFVSIVVGIKYLKEAFIPSKGFKNSLANLLTDKTNSIINKTNMKNIKKIASAKGPKVLLIKLALVGTVLVSLAGIGGYLLYKKSQQSNSQKEEAVEQPDQEDETASADEISVDDEDPYSGWEIYENSVFNYSLRYPSDWSLDSSIAETRYTWAESSGNPNTKDANLLIQKDQYIFYLSMPNNGKGANVCKFSDTDAPSSSIPGEMNLGESKGLFNEDYKELKRNTAPYKYEPLLETPEVYIDHRLEKGDFEGMFYVCQDPLGDNVYFEILRFDEVKEDDNYRPATIMYLTPEQPTEEMLDTMDKISKSVRLFTESDEDPNADWKTYSNTNLGITVKYPSEWEIEEEVEGQFGPVTAYLITVTTDSHSTLTIRNYVEGTQMPNSSENTSSVSMKLSDVTTVYRISEGGNKTNYYYALKVSSGAYANDWNIWVKLGENKYSISIKQTAQDSAELEILDEIVKAITY